MEQRAGKRPRIIRPIENRDENRWNKEQNPDHRSDYRPGRPYREGSRDHYDGNRDGDRYNRDGNRDYGHYNRDGNSDDRYNRRDYNYRDAPAERNYGRHDETSERNYNRYDGPPERNYNRHDAPRAYSRPRWQERDDNRPPGNDRRSYSPRPSYDSSPRPYGSPVRPRWRDTGGDVNQERSSDRREIHYYSDRRPDGYRPNDRRDGDYRPRRDDRGYRNDRPRRVITSSSRGTARGKMPDYSQTPESETTELRLNRYIAKGGVCSRRDADILIQAGRVKVNGEVVQQVGTKVQRTDKVEVDDIQITPERKVYLLLNKPKDYVTTLDDPMERKTVMRLIDGACEERVYPIGRLDRQTTGVLLFTNDGDLAKKLTHPSYNQKKIYHVFLDRAIRTEDIETIRTGIELEDGLIKADDIQVASDDNKQVGIEIHSGKNRVVRRIFERLGYNILRLDRVYFAGITKKNLPRGRWRFLTREEVDILKIY
ncbi:MAG: pseudouridine synthase [Odoribacteraceae bacterium]|nr:pseudouridine synthase [Odoribacteraceae bacterium]